MLDKNKWLQYGFPREITDILGITIHETGNVKMNAQELFDWLANENKGSNGCHYLCDDSQTIQVMPDDYGVYHTGKGLDWGNKHTIAIEIVSSLNNEKYQKAQDRAISVIYSLQKKYNISNDMIFFHKTFDDRIYCPKTILDRYGSVKRFVMEEL